MVLQDMTYGRLSQRRSLLDEFDSFCRHMDKVNAISQMDGFNQQAFGMLTFLKLLEALNLEKKDLKTRERCDKGVTTNYGEGLPGIWNISSWLVDWLKRVPVWAH